MPTTATATAPRRSQRAVLRGGELLHALAAMPTGKTVKWVVGRSAAHLSPHEALCVARGGTFEGTYRNGRVYALREVDHRPPPRIDMRYRDGRAVLQVLPLDKHAVKLWDAWFARRARQQSQTGETTS